jgi:hypothetical protein
LPAGDRGATDDLGDLVERILEHVVEHEGGALGRCQSFQDQLQGDANVVVEGDAVGRVETGVGPPVVGRQLG